MWPECEKVEASYLFFMFVFFPFIPFIVLAVFRGRRASSLNKKIAIMGGVDLKLSGVFKDPGFVDVTSFGSMDVRGAYSLGDLCFVTYNGQMLGISPITMQQTVILRKFDMSCEFAVICMSTPDWLVPNGAKKVLDGVENRIFADIYLWSDLSIGSCGSVVEGATVLDTAGFNVICKGGYVYIYRPFKEMGVKNVEWYKDVGLAIVEQLTRLKHDSNRTN